MSECVVRMERVPKNCDDGCWGSLSGECPWCDHIDGYVMAGNRPPNCPIIAVLPENHGRLVDIDRKFLRVATDGHGMSLNWRGSIADMIDADNMRGVEIIVPAERREE